jgi:hypothetical protein
MSQKVFYRLRIAKADDAEQLAIDRIRDRNPIRALLRSINPVTMADRHIRIGGSAGDLPRTCCAYVASKTWATTTILTNFHCIEISFDHSSDSMKLD